MAVIDEPITDINTGWADRKGKRVEDFVKNALCNPSRFDPTSNTLLYFDTIEHATEWDSTRDSSLVIGSCPFVFSGWVYRMEVSATNPGGASPTFTTVSGSAVLSARFASFQKGVTDMTWTPIEEDHIITVQFDANNRGVYETAVESATIPSTQSTYSIDMYSRLGGAGSHRVKFTIEGADSRSVASIVFNINITTLSLSLDAMNWYEPYVQGRTYQVTGIAITSNLNKRLHVRLYNTSLKYDVTQTVNIGTGVYTTPAYVLKSLTFPSLDGAGLTGVFAMEMWVTNTEETVSTTHYTRYIMCIASAEASSAQLVTTHELRTGISNYGGSMDMYQFSIYNGGLSTGDVTLAYTIRYSDGTAPKTLTFNQAGISTGVRQTASISLEEDTYDTGMKMTEVITIGSFSRTVRSNMTVSNTNTYAPAGGAVLYVNPASRTNSDGRPNQVLNEAASDESERYRTMTTSNIDFVDYVDGWTYDCEQSDDDAVKAKARRCLRVPARGRVTLPYAPLSSIPSAGKTIDLTFKTANVTDYSVPVISIATNPNSSSFLGIIVKPTEVVVHSRDLKTDDVQKYPFREEETINIIVGIFPLYKEGYNYCIIYANGAKVKEFAYESSDSWSSSSNIVLGSDYADLFLYSLRVYDTAIGTTDGQNNYIASLATTDEKKAAKDSINAVLNDTGDISYNKIVGKQNVFVVTMHPGYVYPSKSHGVTDKNYEAVCDVEFEYASRFVPTASRRKVSIRNCYLSGQGTSSMNYWDWNLRWRTDKRDSTEVTYNGATTTGKQSFVWDGGNHSFRIKRATAKKNYASQTQSHKMGATASFTELHDACVGANEARALVAVFQYPFYGFLRTDEGGGSYSYEFLGLFTFGPDKGDKDTFGYNDYTESLEGSNHGLKPVAFMYPTDKVARYDVLDEKGEVDSSWYGISLGGGKYQDSWEIGNAGSNDFMNAYDVIYRNHTMFHSTTSTLSQINESVEAWENRVDSGGHSYKRFEFYTDGVYDLYYKDEPTGKYARTDINLLDQFKLTKSTFESQYTTAEAREERFKVLRRNQFKSEFPKVWNLNDVLFHTAFLVITGATDNFEKNFYPYKLQGGLWRLRQDDLDTIFSTDNQGAKTKGYSIEEFDWTDSNKSAYVFKGEDSAMVHLILECYRREFIEMGNTILTKMASLSDVRSGTALEILMGFFDKYFWSKAQNYFAKSAYNADTEHSYENAYKPYRTGDYDVDISPLEQIVGDDLAGERAWVEKRLIYCMSRFEYGPFADGTGYADSSLGTIVFRTQQSQSFTITPAMDLYPFIAHEKSDQDRPSARVLSGTPWKTKNIGGGNTDVYITAADYLEDIGDLSTLSIDSSSITAATIKVGSKRLKRLKLGDVTPNKVTSNLQRVEITRCDSLEEIDARNLRLLGGSFDLSRCPRIKTALFQGTNITGVILQEGSKIQTLALPSGVTSINIARCMHLTSFTMQSYDSVDSFRFITGTNTGFATLKRCYDDGSPLSYVRCTGVNYRTSTTAESNAILDMLVALLSKHGINAEGANDDSSRPYLEGTITLAGDVNGNKLQQICDAFGVEVSKNITGLFTGLKIVITGIIRLIISFADANTKAICVTNWDTNKDGELDTDEASAVTTIGTKFNGASNTASLFNEFKYFTGVTSLGNSVFAANAKLKEITIPTSITVLPYRTFYSCSALTTVRHSTVKYVSMGAFQGCSSLKAFDFSTVETIEGTGFSGCSSLVEVKASNLTTITGEQHFVNASSLVSVIMPKVNSISNRMFYGCSKLTTVNLNPNIESVGYGAFQGTAITTLGTTTFPNLTTIGQLAFANTPLSTAISCPNCTSIADTCFKGTKVPILSFPSLESIPHDFANGVKELETINISSAVVIDYYAFRDCSNLSNVGSLENVESIGQSAFSGTAITGVLNLSKCMSIGNGAFYGITGEFSISALSAECIINSDYGINGTFAQSGLVSIELRGITDLPREVFAYCKKLKSLGDISSLQSIGYLTFRDCTALELDELSLPNLRTLTRDAFLNCTTIKRITNLGWIDATPGTTDCYNTGTFGFCTALEYVKFPNSCTTVGYYDFRGCTALNSVEWNNIEKIERQSFRDCKLEGDVVIPKLKHLGVNAFLNCKSTSFTLESIIDINSTVNNNDGAFAGCANLIFVVLGASLSLIQGNEFRNCSKLRTVAIKAVYPPTLSSTGCFDGNLSGRVIYVPEKSGDAYRGTTNWNKYASSIFEVDFAKIEARYKSYNWGFKQYIKSSEFNTTGVFQNFPSTDYMPVKVGDVIIATIGCWDNGRQDNSTLCKVYDNDKQNGVGQTGEFIKQFSGNKGIFKYVMPRTGYVRLCTIYDTDADAIILW